MKSPAVTQVIILLQKQDNNLWRLTKKVVFNLKM